MMKVKLLKLAISICFLFVAADRFASVSVQALIVDHNAVMEFDSIDTSYIEAAKDIFTVKYGRTSHGSQLETGLDMLENQSSVYSYDASFWSRLYEGNALDLGNPDRVSWEEDTRNYLNGLSEAQRARTIVMWSWCYQVCTASAADIAYSSDPHSTSYLSLMDRLEDSYPEVTFVYMTGFHLPRSYSSSIGGEQCTGANLQDNNQLIRDFALQNNKVLFDFADIDSHDPDGNYYPTATDSCSWCSSWCDSHSCPSCGSCAHSHCLNCYNKGKAVWWMMAKLAGWGESSPTLVPTDEPTSAPTSAPTSVPTSLLTEPVVTRTASQSYPAGGHSVMVTNPSDDYVASWHTDDYLDLDPAEGSEYTYTVYIKTEGVSSGAGQGAALTIRFYDSNHNLLSDSTHTSSLLTGTNDWTSITNQSLVLPFDASHNPARYAMIYLTLIGQGTAYFDSIEFGPVAVEPNTVMVSPRVQAVPDAGQTVAVDINIADTSDLYGFQFDLKYNPDVLEYTSLTKGDFIGDPSPEAEEVYWITPDVATPGLIKGVAVSRIIPGVAVFGPGTLARIEFRAVAEGVSDITIENLKLSDPNANEFPSIARGGRVRVGQVTVSTVPTDIQVPTSPPTSAPTAEPTRPPHVTVPVTSVPTTAPGPGGVSLPVPGDVSGDGIISVSDLSTLFANWGANPSNLKADLDGDGIVNIKDLSILFYYWARG